MLMKHFGVATVPKTNPPQSHFDAYLHSSCRVGLFSCLLPQVGLMRLRGRGLGKEDENAALAWFELASAQGHKDADKLLVAFSYERTYSN